LVAGAIFGQAPPDLSLEDRAFVEIHFLAAKRAEAAQEFGKAADEYKTILAKFPTALPHVHHNLGLALYFDRKCEAAIASLRQADKLVAGVAGTHLLLGMSYMCLQQPQQALREFLSANKLEPTPETAVQLGMVYSVLNQPRLATKYLRLNLEKGDDKETALYLLGEEYLQLAKSVAEDLIAKNPDTVYDNLVIARIFDSQQFYQVGAQGYLRAIKKDPWNAATLLQLARTLAVLGLNAPSNMLVERYRQLLSSDRDRPFEETVVERTEATSPSRGTDFEWEIQSLPPVDASKLPPVALLESGVNEELKKRLAADRTSMWKKVIQHLADRHFTEAIAGLESVAPQPADWLPYYLIAATRLWGDDLEGAEKALNNRVLAVNTSPVVKMLRWEIFEQLGRSYYGQLLEHYPNSFRAHVVRARILEAQGKPEALDEYQAAIAANPAQAGVRLDLAYFYLASANIPQALGECQRALELNLYSADAKTCLGRIYVEMRQPDEALPFLQAAAKAAPGDAVVHTALGRAFELKNESDKAVAEYKKALELDPSQNKLHYLLEGLYRRLGKNELAEKEDVLFQRAGMAQREEHVNFVQRYYKGGRQPGAAGR
jgi:tetratricopeptide (TPR) repeat protein